MAESLGAYPLRDVPMDLWEAARARAARENLSIRAVIIGLLRGYATGNVNLRLDAEERRRRKPKASTGPRAGGLT